MAEQSVDTSMEPTPEASGAPDTVAESSTSAQTQTHRPAKRPAPTPAELEASLHQRVTTIKEGDNVLLRLPSDQIKAVVASRDGLVQLGKYGAFPAQQLLGLHYDITYEIAQKAEEDIEETAAEELPLPHASKVPFGQRLSEKTLKKMKKSQKKGSESKAQAQAEKQKSNPGWSMCLQPLKRRAIVDAIVDDIKETNEFIDDDDTQLDLLTQEEIAELRKQGVSAEEMMQKQIERHDKFALKTDFSKEKWRQRKEKKFARTVHPIAPTIANITTHYLQRSSQTILHLREDTISQLLNLSNVRPGGKYLIVDDTGGLVTAAVLDRMGCQGRLLTFVDSDSPPAWGVLDVMNFSTAQLECVKTLSWMEAEEDYTKPAPPDEADMPTVSVLKTQARQRKHMGQVMKLEQTRNELHSGNWDGLILATQLNPISVLARLTPYVIGSGSIVVYSFLLQILVESLQFMKKDPNYLAANLTESWTRTYQVLPGRTHPMMSTSGTGGFLLNAVRVHPSTFEPSSHQRALRRKPKQKAAKEGDTAETTPATEDREEQELPAAEVEAESTQEVDEEVEMS